MKNTKLILVALVFLASVGMTLLPNNVSGQSNDQAASSACKSVDSNLKETCENAFKKAAGGNANENEVCPLVNGAVGRAGVNQAAINIRDACVVGFNAGSKVREANQTPDAEKACREEGFSGSELINCKNGYLGAKARKSKDDVCKDVKPDKNKKACEQGFSLAGVVTNTEDQDNQPNCENTGNSLSFVVCPLLDGLANTSDWVFETVIQPLLQNVPVSTDTSDPSYKAWQGFRIIANIILIGALLAVVYYQARGN